MNDDCIELVLLALLEDPNNYFKVRAVSRGGARIARRWVASHKITRRVYPYEIKYSVRRYIITTTNCSEPQIVLVGRDGYNYCAPYKRKKGGAVGRELHIGGHQFTVFAHYLPIDYIFLEYLIKEINASQKQLRGN